MEILNYLHRFFISFYLFYLLLPHEELSTKKDDDEGRNLPGLLMPGRWCLVGFFRPFSDCASPLKGLRTKRNKRYKGPTARARIYACVRVKPLYFYFFFYICRKLLVMVTSFIFTGLCNKKL